MNCKTQIEKSTESKKIVILSNRKIYRLYGCHILDNLKKLKVKSKSILIGDGEKFKNLKTLFDILRQMANFGLQRDGCLILLGGGVIGDLGGLAASLYMRGIDFIQCPTSFLAQVDSSFGGKTAIDFAGVKNLIGTFYQPKSVLIDPNVLLTLDNRQFKTGLAEVIKYGAIQDKTLFEKIEKNVDLIIARNMKILSQIILRSCEIKAEIVSDDEREKGKRAWLNYGHTLGHALESYFGYKILTHGEAIAYGMWFAALLSCRLGFCTDEVPSRQKKLFIRVGLLRKLPRFVPRIIYQKMLLDKKARSGQVQFILTRKIGVVTIQKNIPKSDIFSALIQLQSEASEQH